MDYIKGIDIQAKMRFYSEQDHYDMCLEALEWYKKKSDLELHQIYWRVARSCFKYYGYMMLCKRTKDAKKVFKEMIHYAKETLKLSECHPMGRKYLAIAQWIKAKKSEDDGTEIEMLNNCKKLLDNVIETIPNDHEVRQYRGLWHYKVSSVNRFERFALRLIKGFVIPKGSIDEALEDLTIADQAYQLKMGRLNHRTCLITGLCHISKGDLHAAQDCLKSCQDLSVVEGAVDGDLMDEEMSLLNEKITNAIFFQSY